MLDGILGRGFTAKCKSLIKLTKSRIDVIRRRRNATQKFLEKDIADLLANGLDVNAYGRAEGLLVELTISACYDFIEQSCDFVYKHLSVMQKLRECPEDCRESIASLRFAAARFSDLPELRDLRQMFQERYGNSIEHYENQEFLEKLASKPFTLEKKVQLMQHIAVKFSIKWDSDAFEKRMSKPPVSSQDQYKTYGPLDSKTKLSSCKETDPRGDKSGTSHKERLEPGNGKNQLFQNVKNDTVPKRTDQNFQSRQELARNGYDQKIHGKEDELSHGRQDVSVDKHNASYKERIELAHVGPQVPKVVNDTISKRTEFNYQSIHGKEEKSSRGKQDIAIDNHEAGNVNKDAYSKTVGTESSSVGKRREHMGSGGSTPRNDREDSFVPDRDYQKFLPYGKNGVKEPSYGNGHQNKILSIKAKDDEQPKLKPPYSIALPPPYIKSNSRQKNAKSVADSESSCVNDEICSISKDPPPLTLMKTNTSLEKSPIESSHSDDQMQVIGLTRTYYSNDKEGIFNVRLPGTPLPRPRSVRRKHSKSRSEDTIEESQGVRSRSRSRRREEKQGLQILVDVEEHHRDEEERIIDKLLIHYSKKPSNFEPGNLRRKSKNSEVKSDKAPPEVVSPPPRSISLPREHGSSSEAPQKVFTRAASFQQDGSNVARHVHPKLPDYDDFAARFAALRGS